MGSSDGTFQEPVADQTARERLEFRLVSVTCGNDQPIRGRLPSVRLMDVDRTALYCGAFHETVRFNRKIRFHWSDSRRGNNFIFTVQFAWNCHQQPIHPRHCNRQHNSIRWRCDTIRYVNFIYIFNNQIKIPWSEFLGSIDPWKETHSLKVLEIRSVFTATLSLSLDRTTIDAKPFFC